MSMKTVLALLVVFGVANAVNVALHKPTIQSSISNAGGSSRAVDGNTNSDYTGGSCTHTDFQNQAMWAVDLGKKYSVSHVEIFNRADCCSDRLKLFEIIVSDTRPGTRFHTYHRSEVCATQPGTFTGSRKFVCPRKITGRWVVIRFYDRQSRPLTLCEVKVEAQEGKGVFCHRDNSDCYHHDVARVNDRSLEQCKQACFERTDCMSIQYNYKKECFIKNYACTDKEIVRNSKADDYILVDSADQCPIAFEYCVREKVMCPGRTFASFSGLNKAQCQMRCSVTRACRSVQHQGSSCYLKDITCAHFEVMGEANSVDYIRVCKYR